MTDAEQMWHWSDKLQKIAPCNARKRKCSMKMEDGSRSPHFNDKEDALIYQHNVFAEKYGFTRSYTKAEKRDMLTTHFGSEIPEHKKDLFVKLEKSFLLNNSKLGSELKQEGVRIVHETKRPLKDLSSIRSYDPEKNTDVLPSIKPRGVLWCSPMEESGKGAWGEWAAENMSPESNKGRDHIQEISLKDDSVILELDEYSRSNLALLTDMNPGESHFFRNSKGGYKDYDMLFSYPEDERPRIPNIPWNEMKELGIDVVRVNGQTERDYFYGYDVDSYIILNADAVEEVKNLT